MGLGVSAGGPKWQDTDSLQMPEPTKGELIAIRRSRLGWSQTDLAERAGVSLGTVLRIEKDRNTQRINFDAVIAALEAEEGLVAHGLVSAPKALPPLAMTSPDHPPSTDSGEGGAGDPATARIRELETVVEAQGREITAMRNVLDSLLRVATDSTKAGKAPATKTGRGKGDR